jgi:hypothetical protein
MSLIKFPKWAIAMINSQISHFLWNNNEDKHRYHMANWQLVAQKKEEGGFGIPDMRNLNLSLLSSWIFRYGLHSIWVKIIDHKYKTDKPNILCSDNTAVSPFWKGVMWAFRRAVSENLMNMWYDLLGIVENLTPHEEYDHIIWSYNSNERFSVQSLYAVINHRGITPVYVPAVWNLNILPRVQIFLWLVGKNKALTRDNLAKRREVSDKTCLFCNEYEFVHHLFFDYCVAQRICFLWQISYN